MTWQQYAVVWAGRHGGYDLRRAPPTVRGWLWLAYAVARGLLPLGVTPGAVSLLGVGSAVVVPVAAGQGPLGLLVAAGLVGVAGFADTLDRALTILTVSAPGRAAVRAAVAGGVAEVAWLTAFWLAGVPALLVMGVGIVIGLHELGQREALVAGMSRVAVQTLAERPVRASVAVTALGLAGLAGLAGWQLAPGLLTVAAIGWLLLAALAAGQLIGAVRRSVR